MNSAGGQRCRNETESVRSSVRSAGDPRELHHGGQLEDRCYVTLDYSRSVYHSFPSRPLCLYQSPTRWLVLSSLPVT